MTDFDLHTPIYEHSSKDKSIDMFDGVLDQNKNSVNADPREA